MRPAFFLLQAFGVAAALLLGGVGVGYGACVLYYGYGGVQFLSKTLRLLAFGLGGGICNILVFSGL